MAALPAYVGFLFSGYGETPNPSVERTEMERGVPVERVLNSQVLVQIRVTFVFRSPEQATGFETWYYEDIKRIGWFDMPHPRTGQTITARFVAGNIGTLVPRVPTFRGSQRDVTLEYLR